MKSQTLQKPEQIIEAEEGMSKLFFLFIWTIFTITSFCCAWSTYVAQVMQKRGLKYFLIMCVSRKIDGIFGHTISVTYYVIQYTTHIITSRSLEVKWRGGTRI